MFELLFLLLPVAVCYGYIMGRRSADKTRQTENTRKIDFLTRGINYFLSKDKEEAVNEFIRFYDSSSEHSFEESIALGSLLREKGELEKAIRFHNGLLTDENTEPARRSVVLLELARDFMNAGLLDKAEDILRELISYNTEKKAAVLLLVTIFEQEKEWQKAVDLIDAFSRYKDEKLLKRQAEYYCELGNELYARQNVSRAADFFKKAAAINPACVRAYLNAARIMIEAGQTGNAVACLRRGAEADPAMIPVLLNSLARCFGPGREREHLEILNSWLALSESPELVIQMAELMLAVRSGEESGAFVTRLLKKSPSYELFSYALGRVYGELDPETREKFAALKAILDANLVNGSRFQCERCGFKSSMLFWQCPSCHGWESMKCHQIEGWKNGPSSRLGEKLSRGGGAGLGG